MTYEPDTIERAISDLEVFLISDMWHAIKVEFRKETDMIKYLEAHFKILRRQIREIKKRK